MNEKEKKSSIFLDETGGLKTSVATVLMVAITLILGIVLYIMVYSLG